MRESVSGRAVKIRLNVKEKVFSQRFRVGDTVRFRARIMPPSAPLVPGGYDFARSAWFLGLSGTGSVMGEVTLVRPSSSSGWALASLRQALSRHIATHLNTRQAGIASALVTGDRGGIAGHDDQAMRDSGLAHLLSVSGLHVGAAVGAGYIVFIRVLALWPWLALRVRLPIVAAGGGALVGVAYTLLSGAEVPTVRSCLGSLLVLVALALGRDAVSLRMLGVAAGGVMLLWPESVMGPSFQMSFGAVLALIAFTTSRPAKAFTAPREESWVIRTTRHCVMLLMTGIVIDLVLMPIGLYHFNRAGVYGALANVIAIPLTTFCVMPLLALSLLLDIFGIGAPVWWLVGLSIDGVLGLAHFFAELPGAVQVLPAASGYAYLLFIAGGLWLGLWTHQARWWGMIPVLLGVAMMVMAPAPDVLISSDGRHVLIVDQTEGQVYSLRAPPSARGVSSQNGRGSFAMDMMREEAGVLAKALAWDAWPEARCNADFCRLAVTKGGRTWQVLASRGKDRVPERALAAACDASDIVISERWLPRSCQPRWLKVDKRWLKEHGGAAVYLDRKRWVSVSQSQGDHGWWRGHSVR